VPAQGTAGAEFEHASCFGRVGLQGQQMMRHPAVSFQPSSGGVSPGFGLRLDREGAVVTLQEESGLWEVATTLWNDGAVSEEMTCNR